MRNGGVNWFEGGRRISKLLMGFAALCGLIYVASVGTPPVTFTTLGPGQDWYLTWADCPYPAYDRHHSDFDFGDGKKRSVWLCFEALNNGNIPYAVAPEPPEAALERQQRDALEEVKRRAQAAKDGSVAPPPLVRTGTPQWYYGGDQFSDPVVAYTDQRLREFQLTPTRRSDVLKGLSGATWVNRLGAFIDTFPWVLGAVAFIWIATALVGWIVRGFAGVPRGSDFRTTEPAE
jgi:hypothetical protein